MNDDLGDRMKVYEGISCNATLIPRLPIYARIDGKCFSNFTRNMIKPYDINMSNWMIETTKYLVKETHALLGYTQSDEISLAWYNTDPKADSLFSGKIHKLNSILAALATAKFNHAAIDAIENKYPVFDCRVFNLPNKEELANAFLWRELDATKNAISSAAALHFSPKQLHGISGKEKQEMLFQKTGINFNDYPVFFKRGTFIKKIVVETVLSEQEKNEIPEKYRPIGPIYRHEIVQLDMPRLLSISNRAEVLIDGKEPILFDSEKTNV